MGRVLNAVVGIATVAASAYVAYKVATNDQVRELISEKLNGAIANSRQKVGEMSEDAAMRAARVTKNPEINQKWVAHQWEEVGY